MRRVPFLTATEIQGKQEPPLTPEQIEAKYSSGQNILVSASAGSGKTYVMTQRILDQLSRGVEINQLFISTFTVKAATELKDRLEKEISKEIKANDNVELKQHLSKQLADLPSATIGTMDAFTKNFLEKHGYLINISPNFRILQDENEQLILKNEVFQQVFERFYNGSNQKMFSKLVKNFAGKGKTERGFRQVVYQIYDFLQSTSNPQEWLEKTFLKGMENTDFERFKSELIDTVKMALEDFVGFLKGHLSIAEELFPTAKYVQNIQPVIDAIDSLTPQVSNKTVVKILESVLKKVKGSALSNRSLNEELKEVKDAYNTERKQRCENLKDLAEQLDLLLYQDYYHQEIVELAKVLQEFTNDFVSSYRQRKREENAFEFADISHFTIEILETFDDIRESYQNHFHEVMVDEYQDTNHIQERMLELLSNGHNRFMVGDIKQSIYRFRQADPQIFREKFQAYNQNSEEGKLILLKENFRSGPEVLSATNDIFQHLMDDEVGEITYDDMHKLVYPHPNNSYDKSNETEIILYDKNASKRDDDNEETVDSEKQSYYKLVASEVISLKKKIKNDIKHLEDELKTKDVSVVRANEIKEELSKLTNHPITLLVSSRTNYDEIIQAFSEFGLSVDPDGGQQTYLKSLEVQVMLETLRVINNPLQDYPLVALLKSPMFRFDEDELTRFSLQSSRENSKENFYTKLLNAINKRGQHQELMTAPLYQKLELFLNQLEEWRLYAKTHSLYDLIWKIYNDRFYYDYVGALPNGQTRQANLYALALRAHQFEKTNVKGLHRFIRMIDQVLENDKDLDDVPVEVSEDSIRLMTIHKSKGLEFPYVFILDIDKEFNEIDSRSPIILSRKNGLGFKYIARILQAGEDDTSTLSRLKVSIPSKTYTQNKTELKLANHSEQMRLLYVAMTRAEKKLYLVGKASQENLETREYPDSNSEFLTKQTRLNSKSFNDWIWAIRQVFASEKLSFSYRFVGKDNLSDNLLDNLENKTLLQEDSQANNRQSETIRAALDMLKSVEDFNNQHRASIDLPSVITPSQLKKQAQPHPNDDETSPTSNEAQSLFELPDFSSDVEISGAEIGSATHELMERLDLTRKPTLESLTETLNQLPVREVVRKNVQLTRILTFFDTELGQEVLQNVDKLHREQSFSMLREDKDSKEKYLVRGILDGYILYDDKIVLFDYKTDRYEHSDELIERYSGQLSLYEEALSKAYQISKIEKYLILFGKDEVEVVKLEE